MRIGTASLFVKGSTAALTTIEHESGLVKDLQEFLEKHIPADRRYHTTTIAGATTTAFPIYAPRCSDRRWQSRSLTASRVSAHGSKLSCWTSTIDRAAARSSFNS
jgi:hypothetical protein